MRLPPPPQRRTVRIVPPAAPLVLVPNEPAPHRAPDIGQQSGPSGLNLNLASKSKKSSKPSKSSISSSSSSISSTQPDQGPSPAKIPKKEKDNSSEKPIKKEKSPGPVLSAQDGKHKLIVKVMLYKL